MGMYTELSVSAELKDLTRLEINALMWMVGEIDKPIELPDHKLFECDRCEYMFRMQSYYFPFTIDPIFKLDSIDNQYRLVTRSNLKNYEGETHTQEESELGRALKSGSLRVVSGVATWAPEWQGCRGLHPPPRVGVSGLKS